MQLLNYPFGKVQIKPVEIFHLVYRSVATHGLSDHSVQEILSLARKHNAEHGLTGILIYRQGAFVQLLEGPRNEVNVLYRRIKADQRHQRVTTMIEGNGDQRMENQWSMAFVDESHVRGSIQDLWELFDLVVQGNSKDKGAILPIIKKFLGAL